MRTDLQDFEFDFGAGTYSIRPNAVFQRVFETLFTGVQYVYGFDVVGEIAEFGTMTGKTAGLLAHAVRVCDVQFEKNLRLAQLPTKNLHLFDSFIGLPSSATCDIDNSSPHVVSSIWREGACHGMSATEMLEHVGAIVDSSRVFIHEGWFADTLPQISDDIRFALVHIDCDLYQSTRDVLDGLFGQQRISEGTMILFDDWNCNRASNSFGERRAWAEAVRKFNIQYSDEGGYGWVSHKFIVHSYCAP